MSRLFGDPSILDRRLVAVVFVLGTVALWFTLTATSPPTTWGASGTLGRRGAAALAVAIQLVVSALEATFYRALMGALDRHVAWAMLAARLFTASSCSVFGGWLAARYAAGGSPAWALLVGMHPGAAPGAFAARAIAGVGVLTLMRVALSADALASLANLRHRGALAVVGCTWALSRVAWALVAGLMLGRSYQP